MASCSFCSLVLSMIFLVVALGLTVTSIMTDHWYEVSTKGAVSDEERRLHNYHFGFWRKCYDDPPLARNGDDCEMIYDRLTDDWPANITHDEEVVIHLSRAYICLSIVSGLAQLATIITLLCGSWPGNGCKTLRKPPLYVSATIILLIGICAGISSGICFIAARDVEDDDLLLYNDRSTDYSWSFMMSWVATGLCLIDAFLIMCMVRYSYHDITDEHKYYYSS